ncbi:putative TIM-barrel fold metal-dependent hydrolase [Streptacidiphilus sp. MAP12-16]|uniref:amidohydrolase family protein n=1 Tax=Streptacidiphilus sp. MAP12-16 TaxID=3156300 RepID=UPI0035147EBB
MRLVDHHCHSVVRTDLSDAAFASLLTESDRGPAPGTSPWDSALGLAVRRWCAPALDLDPYPDPTEYLARRRELGAAESTRRLLRAADLDTCFLDTGLEAAAGAPLLSLPDFADASGSGVREIVRLEYVAERVSPGSTATHWAADVLTALTESVAGAVAVKSVLAYRHGLDIDAARPTAAEVTRAAGEHLARLDSGVNRLAHPVLLRHLLWAAVDLGLPIQLHTGFGDPDLTLHRADPSLLTDFVRAAEPHRVPLVLLHCYPYHRQAAWLAQSFPHVYCDVGLTLSYVGPAARRILAETLELAPFGKLLFSTDAYGLPELHLVGAAAFRDAVTAWTLDAGCPPADAARVAALVGADNSRRLYGLPSG